MGFAAGELVAHVNYMLVEGRLRSEEVDGMLRYRDEHDPAREGFLACCLLALLGTTPAISANRRTRDVH